MLCMQASAKGLVKELQQRNLARSKRMLCPVPLVTGGLTEPSAVPNFLAALQVPIYQHDMLKCLSL